MAYQIHRKYELRRRKARRHQRARALFWAWGDVDYGSSDRVPFVRITRKGMRDELVIAEDGELTLVPKPFTYSYRERDRAFFNRLSQEEFWAFQDAVNEDRRRYYERRVHLSQHMHSSTGKRSYKEKYHRLRRAQSRRLCHYALREDEARFESIPNRDYFRGAIQWDIH